MQMTLGMVAEVISLPSTPEVLEGYVTLGMQALEAIIE